MRLIVPDDSDIPRLFEVPDPSIFTTVGDLAAAVGVTTALVAIDAQTVRSDQPLSTLRLYEGSRLAAVTCTPVPRRRLVASLDVVGGLGAAIRVPLRVGRHLVGSSDACDAVLCSPVSPLHARLDVAETGALRIESLGEQQVFVEGECLSPGTHDLLFNETVRLGTTRLAVRRPRADAPAHLDCSASSSTSATVVFNRMPRAEPSVPTRLLEAPVRRAPKQQRSRFSWATLLAPLVMGCAMALLWNPLYALFMVLSPVMTLMNWWEDKHHHRRDARNIEKEFAVAVADYRVALRRFVEIETIRLRRRAVDLCELRRRCELPSVHLWERRPHHDDFLEVMVGRADQSVEVLPEGEEAEPEIVDLVRHEGVLREAPLVLGLDGGVSVGCLGRRVLSRAVVRALIAQAVALHGPGDLGVVAMCEPSAIDEWSWISLLPHAVAADGSVCGDLAGLVTSVASAHRMTERLLAADAGGAPVTVVVVDGDGFLDGKEAVARGLSSEPSIVLVVIADAFDWLPAATESVLHINDVDGVGAVAFPATSSVVPSVIFDGISTATAWVFASSLARFVDPVLGAKGASIPTEVGLVGLLGGHRSMAVSDMTDRVLERWRQSRHRPSFCAPIGWAEQGPLDIDLVVDGPHALVAGTTGSGKSELLRSMVASMAASADAEHLSFLLIDYKGGSAFDVCAGLPHTVGVVTDLDPHLSERALVCLEAELGYRERMFRAHRVDSIAAYRRLRSEQPSLEPLARLVVVIDEFATLVSELPEFVDALVSVAQRGRSLGVHLVLATQRPSGALSENIRTNTNLRIALRVLNVADSNDVIGSGEASLIGRDLPGRACVRLGPEAPLLFQSALATGTVAGARSKLVRRLQLGGVAVDGGVLGGQALGELSASGLPETADAPTDLELLLESITEAHRQTGVGLPRCPWPAPLPLSQTLGELCDPSEDAGDSPVVRFGLLDEPHEQRTRPAAWTMCSGNLFVAGAAKSGVTTTLRTLTVSACRELSPDTLWVYVLDLGRGSFNDLEVLPHVGAVVGPGEHERQHRLLAQMVRLIRDRQEGPLERQASVLFVLDGLEAFRRDNDDSYDLLDLLDTVYLDGPSVGVYTLLGASSPAALRNLEATTACKVFLRLSDRHDLRDIGVTGAVQPDPPPGRGYLGPHGLSVQVATVGNAELCQARDWKTSIVQPPGVGVLPTLLGVEDVVGRAVITNESLYLPVGQRSSDLSVAGFTLRPGEHALITGPARSGKSSVARAIALAAASLQPQVEVRWVGATSPVPGVAALQAAELDDLVGDFSPGSAGAQQMLVVVDDAGLQPDHRFFSEVFAQRDGRVHVLAVGRNDRLRSAYGHWTNEFRHGRRGLFLWPDVLDGDLVGVDLPNRMNSAQQRSSGPQPPGRSVLVDDGRVIGLVQAATELDG